MSQCEHARAPGRAIEWGHAPTVGIHDGRVIGDGDDLATGYGRRDALEVLGPGDPVGHEHHASLVSFSGEFDGPLGNVDRTRRWLDHHHDHVDGCIRKTGQGADTGLEVGDDHGLGGFGGGVNRAEQLLGGKSTSRSTGFGVLDPAHHRQAYSVGRIASEPVDKFGPCPGVLIVAGVHVVEGLAHGGESLGLTVADPE